MSEHVEGSEVETKEGLHDSLKEFDILGPDTEPLTLDDGKQFLIKPMNVRQIREFLKVGGAFIGPLTLAVSDKGEVNPAQLAALDPEAFAKALAVAANVKESELDDLYPDDYLKVVAKVLVVNLDFFALRFPTVLIALKASVGNSLERIAEKIEKAANAHSQLLSKS